MPAVSVRLSTLGSDEKMYLYHIMHPHAAGLFHNVYPRALEAFQDEAVEWVYHHHG